jgi:arylsulfatase A-like enzyme
MRPNILLIQTDDHAQWANGCYGNSEIRTPSLDYLAATGVRMANAFTPIPVCSPARACLMTGRLPSQHGMHDFLADGAPDVKAVEWLKGEITLAQFLHEAGYVTGHSGKWHQGRPEVRQPGFDYWYSTSMPVSRPSGFDSPWPPPADRIGRVYNRHAITDHAVDFMRQRPEDQPFFLFVGYIATHSPWTDHPERLVRHYRTSTFRDIPDDEMYPFGRLNSEALFPTRNDRREALAQYYASVTEIDEQVGRLLDELDTQQLVENTLVIYTSDHGLNTSHHGLWGKGNATRPYNMLEESIRVPMILNHPGALFGGQVRGEMVTHCDLFETILEHAEVTIEAGLREQRRYPGRSFRAHCRGDAREGWADHVFGEYGDLRMVRTRRHKLILRYPGEPELFDLERDPRETENRADDPAYAAIVADLSARIQDYFSRYEDPINSGLRVRELPRHNLDEAWRTDGVHRMVASPDYIAAAQAAIDREIAASGVGLDPA